MKPLSKLLQNFLCLVGHFGHLTSRELAMLNWPNRSSDSALVTAQVAGKKLAGLGLVLTRKLPYDNLSRVYVLTTKGAAWLNDSYLEDWLEHDSPAVWFADGYSVSLNQWVIRRPLIQLLHEVAAATGLHPVGQRSLGRGFLGMGGLKHFDAVLLDDAGKVVFGVYLAHSATSTSTEYVCKLAKGSTAFLVAADRAPQLQAMLRWRERTSPAMAAYLVEKLPAVLAGRA
jgi:hypothetical protein